MKVDVIIVGAGPGGGMAACRLATTGLRVLILEKETLPRHKACGGGLSASAKEILDWDWTFLIENVVPGCRFFYNYTQPLVGRAAPILAVDRSRFDAHLVERAVSLGQGRVELRDGFRVRHVAETADGVVVHGVRGERLQAPFLIAADGAFSTVARCLGLNRDPVRGPAIEAEVTVTAEAYEAEKQRATFNLFCVPYGYGWIFPKREGLLNCGVCAWAGRPPLTQAVDDFLARSLPPGSIRAVRTYAHAIPLYPGRRAIATRRTCLVGDAASLVDPIMGEGIRFALQSGALAAQVIAGLTGAEGGAEQPLRPWDRDDCRAYQSLVHGGIGRYLDNLRRFIQIVFLDAPEFFYRRFILEGYNYVELAQALGRRLDPPATGGEHGGA